MSDTDEYNFATEFAQRTIGEVTRNIDWDMIDAFEGTNIIDVLTNLPTDDRFREPDDNDDEAAYSLDNGSKVSFRLLKVFEESHNNLCLVSVLAQMEKVFFQNPTLEELADVIAAEIAENDNQLFGYSLANFPYHTTMLYFAVKHLHLETEPAKYSEMLNAVSEALIDMKVTPDVSLPVGDTPTKFFSEWSLIEIDAAQGGDFTSRKHPSGGTPPARLM